MTPTERFWAYFREIAAVDLGGLYCQMSDADRLDRLTADSVSSDVFPGIFFMRPKQQGYDENSGLLCIQFDALFYVFVKGDLADYESQDAAYHTAELLITQLLRVLWNDSKEYKILFSLASYRAEPVAYQLMDACWGYEVRLRVGLPVNDLF
jgi:hypothetical protein